MTLQLTKPSSYRHLLQTSARPESFSPHARAILARLGYAIVTATEMQVLEETADPDATARSQLEMLVVDEHRLANDPMIKDHPGLPIIVLTGRHGVAEDVNTRVYAAVKRPAGLHDLYRVLQQFFEEFPRNTPRVSTHLRIGCSREDREWEARVVSLSENGCLMRCDEHVPLGSRLAVTMQLPKVGSVRFEAETAYQVVPHVGLVFNAIAPHIRDAIGSYVHDALAPAWVLGEQA